MNERSIKKNIADAVIALEKFATSDLTTKVSAVEASLRGVTGGKCVNAIAQAGADHNVFGAAALMKQAVGQIDVIIHVLGILLCLPHLLEHDETIEYVSLGAGNTGKAFDLEADRRVAEFKFINWRGGPESIRQNTLFKDFFLMAEHVTPKHKYLYVLGTEHPLKFFNGGRAFSSVLTKDEKIRSLFFKKYGDRFERVREYYETVKDRVAIQDVSPYVGSLNAFGE